MRMSSMYDFTLYKGESLMTWAIRWFSMSNDAFFSLYGFNFNPHEWPGLYEEAQKRVYPKKNEQTRCNVV